MENAITKSENNLPATLEELNTFILIGKQRLIAQKAKIKAIEQANLAVEAKYAALLDAQDMAEILLDAEVKLGEILEKMEVKPKPDSSNRGTFGGSEKTLPPDISKLNPLSPALRSYGSPSHPYPLSSGESCRLYR
jgi:hypothetical protein